MVKTLLFSLLFATLAGCAPRKFELALCKETAELECIPPEIQQEAVYFVDDAPQTGSIADYLNNIYFTGDTLSFHIINLAAFKKKVRWQKDFRVFYTFPGRTERFALSRVDFHKNSITGFSLVGEIFLTYYKNKKLEPYTALPPLSVRYEFYLGEQRFAYRTVLVALKNES